MNLGDFLDPKRIVRLSPMDKESCLAHMVSVLGTAPEVQDPDALLRAIIERENILSTGIGFGIAVPHAKIPSVAGFVIAIGICRDGIDFDSMDGAPVHIIVMIAGPDGQQDAYLRILAKVTLKLRNDDNRGRMMDGDADAIMAMFRSD